MMRSLSWLATSTVAHFASTYMITNAQETSPWAERGWPYDTGLGEEPATAVASTSGYS
jgi:hypothetical protein